MSTYLEIRGQRYPVRYVSQGDTTYAVAVACGVTIVGGDAPSGFYAGADIGLVNEASVRLGHDDCRIVEEED